MLWLKSLWNTRLTNLQVELLLVTLLVLVGLLLRVYKLPELMPFTYDQGRDMIVLADMATGNPVLVGPTTGIHGVFLGPLYYYFLLPGFLLSSGNPGGVALWVASWATLSLVIFWAVAKQVVPSKWALFALAIVVISPGSLNEARLIWNPSLAHMTLLPSIWLLFASLKRPVLVVPSIVLYALSLQTELAYCIFLGPVYLWWLLYHSTLWQRFKMNLLFTGGLKVYNLKLLVLAIFAASLTLVPQILFELRNDFVMTQAILRELKTDQNTTTLSQVWTTRPTHISQALTQKTVGSIPGGTIFFIALLTLFLYRINQPTTAKQAFVFTAALAPIMGLLLYTGNNGAFYDYYLNPHYIFLLLALVISLQNKRLLYSIVAGGVLLWAFYHSSLVMYNSDALDYTLSKQLQALRYTRTHPLEEPYAAEVFVPNLLPTQYQYLTHWLEKSGQLEHVDLWIDAHPQYYLLYEPPISDGSEVAFEEWYRRYTTQRTATCDYATTIGIITIEKCLRQLQ